VAVGQRRHLLSQTQILKENEGEFLDWVEASPENSKLLIEDPIAALTRVFSDLPSIN
jgi:hypothetical protein